MATEKPRYSITLPEQLFKKLEDFRFSNRYQSRSEATVELINLGLESFYKMVQESGLSEKDIISKLKEEFESEYNDSEPTER